jgi:hypothetical protein
MEAAPEREMARCPAGRAHQVISRQVGGRCLTVVVLLRAYCKLRMLVNNNGRMLTIPGPEEVLACSLLSFCFSLRMI